ncbi:protein AGENET DOMAIN (AGD)-CONTAINING P1 [Silene latifolia]|uniref:protein AGENET DOMAIN (AGD)-CONTAINING P1 n=1 Tax=Silene latifolia TaxID=37657 RepID=UPI003D77764A
MPEFEFKKGMKVEISIEEEGFRGAWFSGTIINPPAKNTQKVLIEYDALLADNGSKPLREKVDFVQIRPIPPRENHRLFKLDEDVDAYYNDGWWEGVITQIVVNDDDDDCKYCVYFRPTREQCEFNVCDLRLHREWDGAKWVPPLEEDARATEVKINGKEENPLSKGNRVEVCSDEDGFEGAWFAASIIEVPRKDKFLIEYHDLMTDDNTQLMREEVDAFHIRPCPPKVEVVKFNQYDEVDALYNDGWWVGIVLKVLGRSKYKVFFKATNEEMEFKHEKLRLHQDWINGKWVVASEALNL